MKTKNEYADWVRAVSEMENGSSLKDAVREDAPVVLKRPGANRPVRMVSRGQLKAIRRD